MRTEAIMCYWNNLSDDNSEREVEVKLTAKSLCNSLTARATW